MEKKPSNTVLMFCLLLIPALYATAIAAEKKPAVSTNTGSKPEIMVFAAASLLDVLNEISDSFEIACNIKVKKNLGSSGTLARQIEMGRLPEVFISASKNWINYVDSLGYVQKGFVSEIAKNELVLIAPNDNHLKDVKIDTSLNFQSLLGSGRLSIGDPEHVPAGKHAKEVLDYYGWYEKVKQQILPAKDVRSALMVVEMGESPLGMVYRTDALESKRIRIIGTFPERSHKPIVYIAAVCKGGDAGKKFFTYLSSDISRTIWLKYQFKK